MSLDEIHAIIEERAAIIRKLHALRDSEYAVRWAAYAHHHRAIERLVEAEYLKLTGVALNFHIVEGIIRDRAVRCR
jgi:hypothetical protein